MEKLKNYLIIGLFIGIIILLLTRGCGHSCPKETTKITNNKSVVIRVDTFTQTQIVTKYKDRFIPTYITKADTSKICDKINTYKDSLIDSNITIKQTLNVQGEIKNSFMSYELHVPLRITKTVTITDSVLITKYGMPHYSTYGGLTIGGNQNTLSSIQPFIGVRYKTTYINYGYNLVNSTHNIGFAINLFNIK